MLRLKLTDFEDWLYFKNPYSRAGYYRSLHKIAYTYFIYQEFNKANCEDLMRIIAQRVQRNELSPSAYNNYLKALKLLIRATADKFRKYRNNKPIANKYDFVLELRLKKCERGYIPTLEYEEVIKVLNYAYSLPTDFRRAVALQLAVENGLRFENIRYLEWSDVHAHHLFIKKTKTNKSYLVQIMIELYEKIQKLKGNHAQYVFATRFGLLYDDRFNEFLQRCCKAVGIEKHITAHTLRHTHATLAAENGENLKTIGENLGHSTVRTTEGYVHITEKTKRRAIKRLGISNSKLTAEEIRAETSRFITLLNKGDCQAFAIPQSKNIVITIPISDL